MDTVTHGLTGWLVARALPDGWKGEHPAAATAVVALGSASPAQSKSSGNRPSAAWPVIA